MLESDFDKQIKKQLGEKLRTVCLNPPPSLRRFAIITLDITETWIANTRERGNNAKSYSLDNYFAGL